MICVNNPLTELRKNIENLKHSEYILSAKTEILKNESEESLAILKKNSFSNCIGHLKDSLLTKNILMQDLW